MNVDLLLSRVDCDSLYPPFLARLRVALQACLDTGNAFWVTTGFRTYAEEDALYAQGRSTQGSIVTNAHGGQSWHNFGLAADVTHNLDMDSSRINAPDWTTGPYIIIWAPAVQAAGLEAGANWTHPDRPHCQWPGLDGKESLFDAAFQQGGLGACWALADSIAPLGATGAAT